MSKEGWNTVKFGDVVENVRRNIKDREAARIDRILGLDDIETRNLHVTGWKDADSSPSFRTHFKPGQTLFGKRRAYLRKVAYAEFEGICTQNILVFETKDPEVLLPELLPFICMSDPFMQDAIKNSVGSLFPNADWKAIRNFEFLLPPIELQRNIADTLWAIDELIERVRESNLVCNAIFNKILNQEVHRLQESYSVKPLAEVASVSRGKFSNRPRNLPEFYGGGIPFVQTGDVQNSERHIESYKYTLTELGTTHSKEFPTDTIFMTIAANIGSTAISKEPVYATDSVVGIRPNEGLSVDYLELILRSYRWHLEFEVATQTAQKNINLSNIRPLSIPIAPEWEQKRFSHLLLEVKCGSKDTKSLISRSSELMSAIINNYFGGR